MKLKWKKCEIPNDKEDDKDESDEDETTQDDETTI